MLVAAAATLFHHVAFATTVASSTEQCTSSAWRNNTSCTAKAYAWPTDVTTPLACCAACSADAKCQAWEFATLHSSSHPSKCHMKEEYGNFENQQGTTCGGKAPMPMPPTYPPTTPPKPALPGSPNIVMFLTDDQDQKLGGSFPQHGGVGPMPKTRSLMQESGAMATQWFIHTPICCPSRSELVSGRYFHNLREEVGAGCMHIDETRVNNQSFARYFHENGYTVGMFGKYLNSNPKTPPIGIDAYMTNGGGTYTSPQFDTTGVSDLGPYYMKDGGWQGKRSDYTTAVVGNTSISWLEKVAKGTKPFFAYIAPKACHEPFTPASWYADVWEPEWPAMEPRPVSWNCSFASRVDHHGVIATNKMISPKCADYVTTSFKNRWRALMSVDDVIAAVIAKNKELGVHEKTYYFYSSDHGFQLGEFNILIDKRQMYDHDIRIHLLVTGPGIKHNSTFDQFGTQVDLASTWLGLAGIDNPVSMDGRSIVPLLITDPDAEGIPAPTAAHVKKMAPNGAAAFAAKWRTSAFIEYYFNSPNAKCTGYPTEGTTNNFIGIRTTDLRGGMGDFSYAEYQTGNQGVGPNRTSFNFTIPAFIEAFDLTTDLWQMSNIAPKPWGNAGMDEKVVESLHDQLHTWFNCRGETCP